MPVHGEDALTLRLTKMSFGRVNIYIREWTVRERFVNEYPNMLTSNATIYENTKILGVFAMIIRKASDAMWFLNMIIKTYYEL